jgi:hypothetical protein
VTGDNGDALMRQLAVYQGVAPPTITGTGGLAIVLDVTADAHMTRARQRFTDREAIRALRHAKGLVSVAARALGISRSSLYARMEAVPAVRAARDDARELTIDVAEQKLFAAIEAGEAWAICFLLKCLAKGRGYIEKLQIDERLAVEGTIQHDVNVLDARTRMLQKLNDIEQRRIEVTPLLPAETQSDNGDRN